MRKSMVKVLNLFASLHEVAVGLLQLGLDVVYLLLGPLALGDVADVALNDFLSVFVVKVADEFYFMALALLVLERQVFVANKMLLLQLPKGRTASIFILEQADLPEL